VKTGARVILGVVSLLVLSVLATVSPAQATSGYTTLCRGYVTCANAGMGNDGYAANNRTMYWRMYSGHNCVNYAAYRMVRSGMPNVRPWSGGGNAEFWGTSNASLTDQTPTVGAVAWWRANASPAGSAGHVGYIERVVSPTEIIVSMDWWGGDFTWARIIKGGGSWPSGFIHFNDRKLTAAAAPAVSGTPRVGSTLTSSAATFTPTGATVAYQWRADGVDIAGATGQSLVLESAQEGARITVRATGTKDGYPTATSISAATDVVQAARLTTTAAPVISGVAKVASTLTTSAASFAPAADVTYQWRANGVPIKDATERSVTLRPVHEGKRITVQATATRAGFPTLTVVSAPTAPVAEDLLVNSVKPSVAGTAVVDQTLSALPGTWSPAPTRLIYQWTADGSPIEGATTPTLIPGPELVGKAIGFTVTARKWGYDPVTLSSTTQRVAAGTLSTTVPPVLSGTPRLGQVLTVDPGAYTPEGTVAVQWLRDGVAVPGATATSYPLTATDLGTRLSATTTVTRPGFTTVTTALPEARPVKTTASLVASIREGVHLNRIEVAVSAPGVAAVTGNVQVNVRGQSIGRVPLVNGFVRLVLPEIGSGPRTFTIRYGGTRSVVGLVARRELVVP
jgi:surface antigen